MKICLKCKNANICAFPHKEDVTDCGSYISSAIDWEQRRYEIAKDVIAGLVQNENETICNAADTAIFITDKLIELLKKK